VRSFLLEVYSPQGGDREFRAAVDRLQRAARALSREGTAVRYRRSFFLPAEETSFHMLDGASSNDVAEAARRAAVDAARLCEACE